MLEGKKILLGITGSIAAYKAALITRLLVKEGAEVKVILTEAASAFIPALTLSTLSKNPVVESFVKAEGGEWNNHVELGLWADLLLIAPASSNTLAKCANGICDNVLIATYLSAKCPVVFAPAMDLDMYQHPSTLENLKKLEQYGNHILSSPSGELASGLSGPGRMLEPENIVGYLEEHFSQSLDFKDRNILITAGPTYEAIDPVRFIGNHSSGKMGIAIAQELTQRGAKVYLIHGPLSIHIPANIHKVIPVQSAKEMHEKCLSLFDQIDIAIMAAAVADFRPKTASAQKIKKGKKQEMMIELVKNPDIAKSLGAKKTKKQALVGFALETENEESNAIKKLNTKNMDLIVLNSPNDQGAAFGHDTNKIKVFDKSGLIYESDLQLKSALAKVICDRIVSYQS